jgi:uncharacterized protein (DUF486 family)
MDSAYVVVGLLFLSNIFMTFAWYGHLHHLAHRPVYVAILASWSLALFEYSLQVPANRIGAKHFNLGQLKVIQEVLTMIVFAGYSVFYMNIPFRSDYIWSGICLVGAAYFMFRGQPTH